MRSLDVFLNSIHVGVLSEGEDLWTFDYDASWAAAPAGFDLAPGLSRGQLRHTDGGTMRPVQWYFDNLLPEEKLRDTVSKEAGLKGDDAFALLEYLGAESTGSLVLLPPGPSASPANGLQPLTDDALSLRIRNINRVSLSHGAPKRMSVAGAQNKLLVIYRNGELFEPVGAEPSTHILKPNHTSDDYPASVINEYISMRLADKLGLQPPAVYRRYVPEAVYIIERFDRFLDASGQTQRRHVIDACQLLNKSRSFKNHSANLDALAACISQCRNRASARMGLYRWLVFNILIANDDNHLKNISFNVDPHGIDLCPPYDLLSTGIYHTRAFADHRAIWPMLPMMIPLPGAPTFGEVTRPSLLAAAEVLGLPGKVAERELDKMIRSMPTAMGHLMAEVEAENHQYADSVRTQLGGELRLLRTMQYVVIPEMIGRVRRSDKG
jgi:serine/threonine-protein kinase HipA